MSVQRGGGSRLLPWLQVSALAGLTLVTWLERGLRDWPLLWDPAYFTYVAQALLRGEPIYSTTFMAYPPLAPLLGAGAMLAGGYAGVPSYLAPRFLALLVGVGSVLLVYVLTRRATGSGSAGLLAGIALAGVRLFATSHLATLEPKHLVVLFGLLAAVAAQRRRFVGSGAACALAASAYQPALLLAAAYGLVALSAGGPRLRQGLRFAAGFALGCLPALAVLAATDAWADFGVRVFSLTSAARVPTLGSRPGHWLEVAARSYRAELPFFLAAGAGFAWHAWHCARRGARRGLHHWLDPRWAGMPPVLLTQAVWATVEFQGYPDMYVLLPGIAFFTGWLGWRAIEAVSTGSSRLASGPATAGARSLLLALALVGAFHDGPVAPPKTRLSVQLAEVDRIAGPPDGVLVALSAEEFYVLSERSAPLPFLRLPRLFLPFLPEAGFRDCDAVLERIVALRPRVVVIRIMMLAGGCERRLSRGLKELGWQVERLDPALRILWADRRPL